MQKELFGATPAAAFPESLIPPKTSLLDRYRLNLRLDQMLIVLIGLLVVYVLIFSFGVETGKRYSMAELRAERAKRERMTEELGRKIFEMQQGSVNAAPVVAATVGTSAVNLSSGPAAAAKPVVNPAAGGMAGFKPAGKYTIQTVTVASKTTAEREIKKLTEKGHQAFVIPGGKKLQVCVDGFESRDEASQAMRQLKSRRLIPADAYVRAIA